MEIFAHFQRFQANFRLYSRTPLKAVRDKSEQTHVSSASLFWYQIIVELATETRHFTFTTVMRWSSSNMKADIASERISQHTMHNDLSLKAGDFTYQRAWQSPTVIWTLPFLPSSELLAMPALWPFYICITFNACMCLPQCMQIYQEPTEIMQHTDWNDVSEWVALYSLVIKLNVF